MNCPRPNPGTRESRYRTTIADTWSIGKSEGAESRETKRFRSGAQIGEGSAVFPWRAEHVQLPISAGLARPELDLWPRWSKYPFIQQSIRPRCVCEIEMLTFRRLHTPVHDQDLINNSLC